MHAQVMGGASTSSFTVTGSSGVFSGTVTTANNGGFAGCRTLPFSPALRLNSFRGLRLRVRGDGQRYKLILRDDYEWNGVAWAYSFDTRDGKWVSIDAPFSEFVPTRFARKIKGVTLKSDSITTLQITLSKFEYDGALNPAFRTGAFRLEIEEVRAIA
jgi:hypothetical protein